MSSSLSDKNALVLELGARYARCGLSGERAPRCVKRWQVGDLLQTPLSASEWHEFLCSKLHTLCYDLLLVNPTRRRFVVCEDLLLPRVFREMLLRVLFDVFNASAVTLVPSMLAVLYATANHTALVVDCGWAETRLLPVFKGIPLPYFYETVPVGSRNCCEVIQRELNSSCDQRMDTSKLVNPVTDIVAEDILERACFAQQKDPLPNVVDAEFQTQGNDVLQVPGFLRTSVVEQLLSGDEGRDGTSIVDGIVQVLRKAPLDVRAAMLENLLLVGGTAMIPGLAQRVVAEAGQFMLPLKAHVSRQFHRKNTADPKEPVSPIGLRWLKMASRSFNTKSSRSIPCCSHFCMFPSSVHEAVMPRPGVVVSLVLRY
ncbi:unnamed protein product [Peronospora belbahrii]|uniref:Actin-related protein 10 n=1 Tax=Peronospora belbahrii TaxID=622444 RepID=A0AAU9KWC9_9STRA|nr:unnamed protein product [Peronospora belbahrii]